ncbi:MAG: biotin--[acetyl-CoA-carboxylase] ligase [Pseudomonadales bacterium]
MDLLSVEEIRSHLSASAKDENPEPTVLSTIDSTNAEALRNVEASRSGAAWFAEEQTAGRGRRGKRWVSPEKSNLYMSLLWKFDTPQAQLGGLSLAVGVTVAERLRAYGVLAVQLKWPNDILVEGRKLGGILLEMQVDKIGRTCVVVGVGLNINMSAGVESAIDQPWTDLNSLLSSSPRRNEIAASLLEDLSDCVRSFELQGFAPFSEKWEQYDVLSGRSIRVFSGETTLFGTAAGVAENGALNLRTDKGVQPIYGGEVSVRLVNDA